MDFTTRRDQYDPSSLPDLTGKIALVTGSNSPLGIGWNIANQLALKGAKVYVHARTLDKAQAGITAILTNYQADQYLNSSSTGRVSAKQLEPFVVELGDLKAVRDAAAAFAKKESRLDILVHNAAVLAYGLEFNDYGISTSMTINHIAPFLLTLELLPLIKKTAQINPGVRIVTLSSIAHVLVSPDVKFDSLKSFNNDFGERDGVEANLKRYAYSKLANILFAKELQHKLDHAGIQVISVAVHPGGVKTDGSINYMGPDNLSKLDDAQTPLQGALAPLSAAASTEVWAEKDDKGKRKWAGAYVMPYGIPSPADESEAAKNPKLPKELWEATERILAENVGISVSF
ncbi:short-chain dehydrogenase [Lentinula aciculospora]|uniref:Short-chain dehydrogenase n=1 Tax=Lentinula aciculospora TaxID=153920 RepID=A0A9W9ACK3_9AGAR|nr:short-chain dehydrogenase [Lentinula aciculospora]